GQLCLHDGAGLAQALRIADDERTAPRVDVVMGEAAHDDLRADAGRVAHGDGDDGTHEAYSAIRGTSLARQRHRVSASPNAPALVRMGIARAPTLMPSGTPGSTSSISRMPSRPRRASTARAVAPPVTTIAPNVADTCCTISASPAATSAPR